MPFKNREDLRRYQREYYRLADNRKKKQQSTTRRNKERYATDSEFKNLVKERVKQRKISIREILRNLVTVFRQNGCRCCGETESCCLVAHHVDPSKKEFAISAVWYRGYSPKRLIAELAKCICLCENCHRKHHAGIVKI